MRKLVGLFVLVVSVAVVGSSVMPSLEAQDKSKTKAKKEEKTGTVEIYKAKDGYRFRIKDAEGKVIAMPPPSRVRENKDDVAKDLEEIKATLNKVKPTDVND
jgi:uncharacterized protein YegP (UPF0339 family)